MAWPPWRPWGERRRSVAARRSRSRLAPFGLQVTLPAVFQAPIRSDVVHIVHTGLNKNHRQAYAVSSKAGHQTAAESWGTGRAVSRIPRVPGGGTHRAGALGREGTPRGRDASGAGGAGAARRLPARRRGSSGARAVFRRTGGEVGRRSAGLGGARARSAPARCGAAGRRGERAEEGAIAGRPEEEGGEGWDGGTGAGTLRLAEEGKGPVAGEAPGAAAAAAFAKGEGRLARRWFFARLFRDGIEAGWRRGGRARFELQDGPAWGWHPKGGRSAPALRWRRVRSERPCRVVGAPWEASNGSLQAVSVLLRAGGGGKTEPAPVQVPAAARRALAPSDVGMGRVRASPRARIAAPVAEAPGGAHGRRFPGDSGPPPRPSSPPALFSSPLLSLADGRLTSSSFPLPARRPGCVR